MSAELSNSLDAIYGEGTYEFMVNEVSPLDATVPYIDPSLCIAFIALPSSLMTATIKQWIDRLI
jgi:hypothetical protein